MMLIIKTLLNDNDVEDGDTFSKVWEYWQPGTYSTADKYLQDFSLKYKTLQNQTLQNTICRQIICMALQTDGLKLYLSQVQQIVNCNDSDL